MNHDVLEQEALLIGALLVSPELLVELELKESDFGAVDYQMYYSAISSVAKSDVGASVFSVDEYIKNSTGISHRDVLMQLSLEGANQVRYYSAQLASYAKRIKKESVSRAAYAITSALIDNLNAGNPDYIGQAVNELMNIDSADMNYDHSFDDVAISVVDEVEKNIKGDNGSIQSGMTEIDKSMGGLFPSDLIIIPARPAMGKTAFMVNMFLKCKGIPGVISGEQGASQIGVRSVCIAGKVNHHDFRTGQIEDEDWTSLNNGIMKFKEQNGRIFDKPAPTMAEIEKTCRNWVYKHNVSVIFVDYAQRIRHENKKLNKYDAMSDIAMRLKELARALNVPVIALAQVNRSCEGRPNKRPEMGDIADASAFEKEADAILTLYRDEVYNPDTADKGVIEIDFKKNRHGPTGCVRMRWDGKYMRIDDFNAYEQHQESHSYE